MISYSIKPPSTRYVGSKRKVSNWIINNVSKIEFDTFLDAFGGTGIIGYHVKMMGKQVTYNDKLKFNSYIGKSLIENNRIKLSQKDLNFILKRHWWIKYPNFIQKTFKEIYYTNEENKWLDMIVTNIRHLNNNLKKSIALNALFQSCIVKRPYNLFHRHNLYMRFAKVQRNFSNKKSWDTPFEIHFENFVNEINSSIFDNGQKNTVYNSDVFDLPEKFDLVYIDTPYMSPKSKPIDYRSYYHFLEGLANYNEWENFIDYKSKNKCFTTQQDLWTNKSKIKLAFGELFNKFKNSIIVVSYRSGGIPTEYEIKNLLSKYKKNVVIKRRNHQYALSKETTRELLFIAS